MFNTTSLGIWLRLACFFMLPEVFCFLCKTASQKARCPATFVACLLLSGLELGLKWAVRKIRSSGKVLNKMRVGTVDTLSNVTSWTNIQKGGFYLLRLLAARFLHTPVVLLEQSYRRCSHLLPFHIWSALLIFRQISMCLCLQWKSFGDIPQTSFSLGMSI